MWSVSEAKQTEGFASLGGEVRGPAFGPTLLSFRGAQAGLCWPQAPGLLPAKLHPARPRPCMSHLPPSLGQIAVGGQRPWWDLPLGQAKPAIWMAPTTCQEPGVRPPLPHPIAPNPPPQSDTSAVAQTGTGARPKAPPGHSERLPSAPHSLACGLQGLGPYQASGPVGT